MSASLFGQRSDGLSCGGITYLWAYSGLLLEVLDAEGRAINFHRPQRLDQ